MAWCPTVTGSATVGESALSSASVPSSTTTYRRATPSPCSGSSTRCRARHDATLEQLADLLGIGDLLDRPVRLLSLGERMRCELVAALLHEPPVLFLDEPTIGLDVVAKERMRTFIRQLNQERGTTILLTTHDLVDIEQLCQRVIIIDKGIVIYDGTLAAIKQVYGRERTITFSFLDDGAAVPPPDQLADELAALGEGLVVSRRGDG